MNKKKHIGQIMIECPNTIFSLYVANENELSKIEMFMNNIKTVKMVGLHDIYNWCNRQGIVYDTYFNYHKDFSLWKNAKSYFAYYRQKYKYQYKLGFDAV